mmetsp:Transcript_98493/g.185123  ORF Transcript_98493/g.185123 Transcript_98493/m.185123 type:complete len:288 (-) Transcript_98493:17-880(-)
MVAKDNSPKDATTSDRRDRLPRKWRRASELEDWRRKELEKKMFEKYKFVKFLDRKKVDKKLKSCRKSLEAALEEGKDTEVATLRSQLRQHLADAEYIEYYPKHLPYNSLYPKVDSEASQARREKMRELIRAERGEATEAGVNQESEPSNQESRGEEPKESGKQKKGTKRKAFQEVSSKAGSDNLPQPKLKKREDQRSDQPIDASKTSAEQTSKLKKKKKLQSKEKEIKGEQGKVSSAPEVKTKVPKKLKVQAKDEEAHPSWNAAKSSKVSGALVPATGDRVVFSDSE